MMHCLTLSPPPPSRAMGCRKPTVFLRTRVDAKAFAPRAVAVAVRKMPPRTPALDLEEAAAAAAPEERNAIAPPPRLVASSSRVFCLEDAFVLQVASRIGSKTKGGLSLA